MQMKMKAMPDNVTVVQLSEADLMKAIEYYLNDYVLKSMCRVTAMGYPDGYQHLYEIMFEKPEPSVVKAQDSGTTKAFVKGLELEI